MYSTQITSGRLGDYPYGVSLPLIKEGQSYSGPLQSRIETISASVEQPRLTPYRAGPSGSGRAYPHSSAQAAESHPGTSRPWVNGSAAGFKISENEVSKKLNTADPLQAFILNPHNYDKQLALYTRLACKDLPDFFKNAKITENAVPIRNFLGIITKDVQPEECALFNKCCVKVMRADDVNKECKIGDSIGHLINKYGVESMNKFVDAYSYCCLIAWRHYNPGYEGTPTPEEI